MRMHLYIQDLFLACPVQYRARPFWVEGGEHNNLEAILRCVSSILFCALDE